MDIIPAIDVSQGRVVRLRQGDYNQVTAYELTPVKAAQEFERQGAGFLHVVDLDGAKAGKPQNFPAIKEIIDNCGLRVEVGGGLREAAAVDQYLQAGAWRVILGTAALARPQLLAELISQYGPQIVAGVDARQGQVAVSGWTQDTTVDAVDFCRRLARMGLSTVIFTDIATDGMLAGANREVYPQLTAIPGLHVVASGGVTDREDVISLRQCGCQAAIIGKALYAGRIKLAQAIAWAREEL